MCYDVCVLLAMSCLLLSQPVAACIYACTRPETAVVADVHHAHHYTRLLHTILPGFSILKPLSYGNVLTYNSNRGSNTCLGASPAVYYGWYHGTTIVKPKAILHVNER